MNHLIKAELFKLKKHKSIWIILLVTFAACSISIFSGMYTSAENAFMNISKDVMVINLSLAIYSGISLYSDFENRTIIHYIFSGQKRSYIITALFIRYFIGCIILILLYPTLTTLFAGMLKGYDTSFSMLILSMMKITFMGLPLYLFFCGLYFMITIIVRRGVVSIGISIATSILIIVFINKLYYGSTCPETSAWRFAPSIQLQVISTGEVSFDYFISLVISVVTFIFAFFISKISFKMADIK